MPRDSSGQQGAYHRSRRRKPAPPCPETKRLRMGSALLAVVPCFVASTLARLNVRPPMAALKTWPVRFLRSLHYRRSGLNWVQPRHMSSSSLSLAGCVQVRVLLAKEPRKVRRPAKLVHRNPTARSSRLLSLASSSRIGGAVRGTTPSLHREKICGCSFFRDAGEAGVRLPSGPGEDCAVLRIPAFYVGALAACLPLRWAIARRLHRRLASTVYDSTPCTTRADLTELAP